MEETLLHHTLQPGKYTLINVEGGEGNFLFFETETEKKKPSMFWFSFNKTSFQLKQKW